MSTSPRSTTSPRSSVGARPYLDTRQWVYQNEAWSSNDVNASHTFTLNVYGLKLEYDPSVDYRDGQTPFIDSDAAGSSYDGIFDAKDAAYFGGILMMPWPPEHGRPWTGMHPVAR